MRLRFANINQGRYAAHIQNETFAISHDINIDHVGLHAWGFGTG